MRTFYLHPAVHQDQAVFEQVVFSGGGNRCWWQAGFWEVVAPAIELHPRIIGAVSAGAATACMLQVRASTDVLAYYRDVLRSNRRNVYLSRIVTRRGSVFPHAAIYRQALKDVLGGEYFEPLKDSPTEIRIQYARLPARLGPRSAVFAGLIAYNIEKYWKRSLHPVFGRRLGFTPEIGLVGECATEDDLASLIIASSCTPPFTPIEMRGGRPTLDGGMVDNVPVDAVDAGRTTLVLVTRRYPRYPNVFTQEGRLYVQPSRKVPVSSWDYTDPDGMQRTYEQGREDGGHFLKEWSRDLAWVDRTGRPQSLDGPRGLQA